MTDQTRDMHYELRITYYLEVLESQEPGIGCGFYILQGITPPMTGAFLVRWHRPNIT
jgi:hypothetical protein